VLFQLRFIDTVFVAEDNDQAGRGLYENLKRKHPRVRYIRQNVTKDADDILKSEFEQLYVTRLWEAIKLKQDLVLRAKPLKL
jgi:hypothetical protein